ncbi:hypothetical protein O0I10_002308 [Lichtheimia ornata]|uniref:Galactose oxidase n=1 Tax=Lichtheimia ornata TaxID=688661 RepID=A0AAD7VAE3_9FUNG|nr:uncharacterized protein O0I10_002308 [Lichtheimia ornata]KAJ8661977.1 hypothetical protein O0I10_002308 [Lichtheimia ornata]
MRPFSQIGAATFVRDNVLYTIGGLSQYYNTTKPNNHFVGFHLNQLNGDIETDVPTSRDCPELAYGQAVLLPDNDRVLLFGGKNEDLWDENTTLLVHEYRFSTSMWQQLNVSAANNATNNGTVPRNTHRHTATLAPNGKVYIYGGLVPGTITRWFIHVWEYDPDTGRFTEFPIDYDPVGTVSLTSIALQDGKIVYVMYHEWAEALIFDTNRGVGYKQELSNQTMGKFPDPRIGANAILAPDNSTIYYFGGRKRWGDTYNEDPLDIPQTKLVAFNKIDILDTKTWAWLSPKEVRGEPAKARYDASAALLYGKYWTFVGGISEFLWTNDLNVLEIPEANSPTSTLANASITLTWLHNITDPNLDENENHESRGLGGGAIAGIVVGSLAGAMLVIITLVWMMRHANLGPLAIWEALISLIWDRRAGEPLWTAILHSVSKLILTGLFIAYCVYSIIQIVQSSETTVTMSTPVNQVRLPDIRFCFDNFRHSEGITNIQSDIVSRPDADVMDWGGFWTNLSDHFHMPYYSSSSSGDLRCWMFTAPPDFKLDYEANSPKSNGTRLRFLLASGDDGTSQSNAYLNQSRVHISVYHPDRNPIKVVYNISNQPNLSDDYIQQWLRREASDQQTENSYTMEFNTYSSIGYQLKNHRYLVDTPWNAVGFAQIRNNTPEVETSFRTSIQDGSMMIRNVLDVYPASFAEIVEEDQRVDTLMSASGLIGGMLSLFTFILTTLYGARPTSMYGWIMKLPFNKPTRSIERNLLRSFGSLGQPIPFVHPVDPHVLNPRQLQEHKLVETAYSNTATDDLHAKIRNMEETHQREMAALLKRLQLMELVFKSYYIDDEVFNRLHDAHCAEQDHQNSSGTLTPTTTADNDGIFTRLFRRRRYRATQNVSDEEQPAHNSAALLLDLPEKNGS